MPQVNEFPWILMVNFSFMFFFIVILSLNFSLNFSKMKKFFFILIKFSEF